MVLPNIHAHEIKREEEKYLPILQLFEKYKEITRGDVEEALGVGPTRVQLICSKKCLKRS